MEQVKTPLAELPEWILTARTRRPKKTAAKRIGELIPEGERNNRLHTEASRLRAKGRTGPEIAAALTAMNRDRCDPPLPDAEVQTIVTSVTQYAPGIPTTSANEKNHFWWFPIDVNKWCTDIRIMVLKDYQVGWLTWLRNLACKRDGFLPNDPETLAVLAHASNRKLFLKEMATVMAFFDVTKDESQIYDPEMVAHHAEKVVQIEQKRTAGKASAAKRRKEPT
jgi:hypothetical protein